MAVQDAPVQDARVAAPVDDSADSLVNVPELKVAPVVAGAGEVVLAVEGPWYVKIFDPSVEGCPPIHQSGTPVPEQFADQAITIGAANGVTIVKR